VELNRIRLLSKLP